MGLIATGDNLRNKAMLGLEAMSQEEAEREAVRQQMLRAEKAQRAQLAGTGLGIGGGYVVNNYGGQIADYARGLFGGGAQPPPLNTSPITQQSSSQALSAAGNPAAQTQVANLLGTSSALSGTPSALAAQAPAQVLGTALSPAAGVAPSVAAAAAPSAGSITLGGATTTLSAATPAAQAASGAAATGAAAAESAAAVANAGAATPAAGAPFMAMAGPLAIGVGAFFLLDALFDF